MSVTCDIQFPDSNKTTTAELDFDISGQVRPRVTYNYQIGYLENPRGALVYRDKECRTLWFTIRRTK